jgi:hypothetical protein
MYIRVINLCSATAYFRLPYCFPLQLYSVSRRRAKTYNLKVVFRNPVLSFLLSGCWVGTASARCFYKQFKMASNRLADASTMFSGRLEASQTIYLLLPCFAIKLLLSPQSQTCGPAWPSSNPCSLIILSICLARVRFELSVVRPSAQP